CWGWQCWGWQCWGWHCWGGARLGEGRVEVLKGNEWGSVCDDRWNLLSASVLCRQLGFGSAREALTGARLGQGSGPIHLTEVQCSGLERSLADCPAKNISQEDCQHVEDASVRCHTPYLGLENSIRINGGRMGHEGRVEVLTGVDSNGTQVWGLICGEGWGTLEAMVVCRQLGLGFANHGLQVGTTFLQLSRTRATGSRLQQANGRCHIPQIRIVGGRTSREGRVEILLGKKWGIVCSDGWTTKEAMVVCQQLGLGYSLHAVTVGVSIAVSRVGGWETASDLILNAGLVQQSAYIEDRPLHMLYCAAEENCLSSSAKNANWPYGHRRLLRFSSQIHNIGRADFRPKASRHSWVWHHQSVCVWGGGCGR
uniref:Lysyl oxidase homolog n=1 Tax=Callorhinchus milii TaxID=7868 RepID=A0A4W3GF63_CALMI